MNKKLYVLLLTGFLYFLTACQHETSEIQVETIKISETAVTSVSEKTATLISVKVVPTEIAAITESVSETGSASESSAPETAVTVISTETSVTTESVSETETEAETETDRIPPDGELVRILDYIPDAVIDLRYATTNNFTETVIYDDDEAYLCYGTVKKLCKVQEDLKENGFRMIIWDAYRPEEAQRKLWEVCPNPTYVANPKKGLTSHSRGNTIDIGIVYEDGSEAELPSAFDEFSLLADRDYSDVSDEAAENSRLLEKIMNKHGFKGYWGEWWDYSDIDTYDLIIPEN